MMTGVHVGHLYLTLTAILRIPVYIHIADYNRILPPERLDQLGAADPEGTDFRACANFGPLLRKSVIQPPHGGLTLTWDTVTGKTYTVERSTSLAPNQWITLQSNVAGDGTIKSFNDTNLGTATRLFYRVAVTPVE